jgi:hypothetical protein
MSPATEFVAAWRAVTNAKLVQFRRQCCRLDGRVRQGAVSKADAVGKLREVSLACALVRALGEDRIESFIVEAFARAEFNPCYATETVA